jgi:hypothetical protein
MKYNPLIHRQFSDRVQIEWDDTNRSANLVFVLEDATAIVLAEVQMA